MHASPPISLRRTQRNLPRLVMEKRRHRRLPLSLAGRFMRSDKQEYPCHLINISVGGAAVLCQMPVTPDETIIAYFEHLGGLEGKIARIFDGGFAMKLRVSAHKREKLAAQITFLVNRHELPAHSDRQHTRWSGSGRSVRVKLDEGIVIDCSIIDLSISGASLETNARPPLDTVVEVGKLKARVKRHHTGGIGVQFFDVQTADSLRQHFD